MNSLPDTPSSTISLAILWQVWAQPRAVLRAFLPLEERDERLVVFLGFLSGWLAFAGLRAGFGQDQLTWAFIAFCPGPIFGFLQLYLYGIILRWTGSWLGGQATAYGVRAALTVSNLPHIVWGMLKLPTLLFLLPNLPPDAARNIVTLLTIVELVITLWWFVILLKSLSEVNQFSTGRAFIALVLSYLVTLGPFWACGLIGAVGQLFAQAINL